MKARFFNLFLLTLLFAVTGAFKTRVSAGDEKEYIMCIVHGDYTREQGIDLAAEFRKTYPAVSVSRLDAASKKFFIVYEHEKVSRDNVIDFFSGHKMKATCLHKGVYGVDKIPDITAEECR